MSKRKFTAMAGFTLAELAVTTAVAAIVTFGIGVMLVDSQRGWQVMYSRINSDVMNDSYVARKAFDAVIRKASKEKYLLDSAGAWLEVYYYAGSGSTVADRYARFYVADGRLNIEYGKLNPRETLTIQTVCGNVSSCIFKASGCSAQMLLILDNGSQTITVVSSAVMHNQ
jgi:hypothetical protein